MSLMPASDDPLVTLNTRVPLSMRRRLEQVAAEQGITLKSAVEQAIAEKWGPLAAVPTGR